MSLTDTLLSALESGVTQIGQISIQKSESQYILRHIDETGSDLEICSNVQDARRIGLYGPNGEYRFTKGQLDLITGWEFHVSDISELRLILDAFYPASLGLWQAWEKGQIRVQHLRDKLNRQTGMYRFARTISDDGAQDLVQTLCGPGNNCVKKILWKIDADTPLADSEASRFNGIIGDAPEKSAIPLVCQEACNFFVSECRKRSKKEFETQS